MAGFWQGKSVIMTGGASGIGLALSRALVARGAELWLTDVDPVGASMRAKELGDAVRARALDVRDADGVRSVVDEVLAQHGQLDVVFNNAGIGVAGESHTMDASHFDRTIDINVRGVTNGVVAAYPRMVEQGHGILVNTASAAGLLPVPLMSAYAMSKHAVVGLSDSLRLEARNYGVQVSVLCPAAIETPLLDSEGPDDLEKPWRPDLRRFLTAIAGAPYPVDDFAEYALRGIEAGRAKIIAPAMARAGARLGRWLPGLAEARIRSALAQELADRP